MMLMAELIFPIWWAGFYRTAIFDVNIDAIPPTNIVSSNDQKDISLVENELTVAIHYPMACMSGNKYLLVILNKKY